MGTVKQFSRYHPQHDADVNIHIFVYMQAEGQRISQVISHFCKSKAEFARTMGVTPQSVSNWVSRGAGKVVLNKILSQFPEVNANWLLSGKGEMLNKSTSELSVLPPDTILPTSDEPDISLEPSQIPFPRSHYQPIYDIRVCAGQGIGLDGNENKIVKWVAIPEFRGCQGMMVFGDSMYDKYKSGDVVFFRRVFNRDQIENGQPYIIITPEDRLLKLIYDEGDPDYITLVSYNVCTNPDGRRTYPDMKVLKENILFLYKIVGRLERSQI